MKVWVLAENTSVSDEYLCEHGLSLYIETGGRRILFDTGSTGLFAVNAQKMGVDLSRVDIAVLSHGHYDHGGGIETFLRFNNRAKVYVQETAFEDYGGLRASGIEYIGLDRSLIGNPRIVTVHGGIDLGDGMEIFSGARDESCHSPANEALFVKRGGEYEPDGFSHEQYLVFRDDAGDVLITGCAHLGIVNIMKRCVEVRKEAPRAALGGFHLCMYDGAGDKELADEIAEKLMAYETNYYTGHCTGLVGFNLLKARMGERVARLASGMRVEI